MNGCVNSATTTITLNPLPILTTTNTGIMITSNQNGGTYQWLDCNNNILPITGSTNQSFTAATNGNYAVLITLNGCSDTSSCVNVSSVGINEITNNSLFSIYPNPLMNDFTLEITNIKNEKLSLLIFYAIGKRVIEKQEYISSDKAIIKIDMENLNSGIYFIQLLNSNNNIIYINKLIKD